MVLNMAFTVKSFACLLLSVVMLLSIWKETGRLRQYNYNADTINTNEEGTSGSSLYSLHSDLTSFAAQAFPECYSPSRVDPVEELSKYPWSDIDWRGEKRNNKGKCGWDKCFYPSLSNTSVGYLVARRVLSRGLYRFKNNFRNMKEAFELGLQLQENGASVLIFSRSPPMLMNVSFEMACLLEDRVSAHVNDSVARKIHVFPNATSPQVIVQRVPKAMAPNFLLGTQTKKASDLYHQWASFAKAYVQNLTAFREQFSREVLRVQGVLGEFGYLCNDFQVLVDAEGNLHHLDLDRAITAGWWSKERKQAMCEKVNALIRTRYMRIILNAPLSIQS